jgi:hypothetical protein
VWPIWKIKDDVQVRRCQQRHAPSHQRQRRRNEPGSQRAPCTRSEPRLGWWPGCVQCTCSQLWLWSSQSLENQELHLSRSYFEVARGGHMPPDTFIPETTLGTFRVKTFVGARTPSWHEDLVAGAGTESWMDFPRHGRGDITLTFGRLKMLGSFLVPTMVLCSLPLAWPPLPPELAALLPWHSLEVLTGGFSHQWLCGHHHRNDIGRRLWGYIRKGIPTADSYLGPLLPSFPSSWPAEVLRAPDCPTALLRETAPGIPVPFSAQPMHSNLPGTLAPWLFNQQGHKVNTKPAPLSPRCYILAVP